MHEGSVAKYFREEALYLFRSSLVCDCKEGVRVLFGGLFQGADAPEVGEEALARGGADTGNLIEFADAIAHFAALAVIGDREAVGLVADLLDDVQDGAAAVEDDRFVLLSVDVDNLFAFRDGRERESCEAEFLECGCRSVELAEPAVDEDE